MDAFDELRGLRAVAFDMDGLMYDTEKVYWKTAEVLLGRRGCPYTEELCDDIMGRPAEYCFRRMIEYYSLDEDWHAMQCESEEIFLSLLDQAGSDPMPGLFVLLDELERLGFPKAVCTSSSRRSMSAVLRKDRLESRFDFVITCQDIVRGKPDPEIYRSAASRFGFEPASVLVLEDSVAGTRAAHAAGSPCVVVLAEHNRHLSFPEATKTVTSLDDPQLLNLLRSQSTL